MTYHDLAKRLLPVVVAGIGLTACATEPVRVPPKWFATTGGCQIWDVNPRVGEIATWSGSCVDDYAEGQGKLDWMVPDIAGEDEISPSKLRVTSFFVGRMQHGLEQGAGFQERLLVNSPVHEVVENGFFKDSNLEGPGTVTYADGVQFKAHFHFGKIEGFGISEYPDGMVFAGNYIDGSQEGHGRLTWQNGFYDGDFHLNLPNGAGRLTLIGAGTLEHPQFSTDGTWRNGCLVSDTMNFCVARRH